MTINELQKILNRVIEEGKGDYQVVVQWRDGGGIYHGRDTKDEDVTPIIEDDEKVAVFLGRVNKCVSMNDGNRKNDLSCVCGQKAIKVCRSKGGLSGVGKKMESE